MAPTRWVLTLDPRHDGDAGGCACIDVELLAWHGAAGPRIWPTTPQQVRNELSTFMRFCFAFFDHLAAMAATCLTTYLRPALQRAPPSARWRRTR